MACLAFLRAAVRLARCRQGFLITAMVKPFNPRDTGLWVEPGHAYSWALGVMDKPRPGQELLGWWIIPVGLGLGMVFGWLTWRFGIFSVRRMRRRARG